MASPINAFVPLSVDYGASMSGTLNTGAGSNIEGLVFIMGDPSGVTVMIGGQAATARRNDTGNNTGVTVYTREGLPANSALPVVVNFPNGYTESSGFAVAVNDIDQNSPIATANGVATNYISPTAAVSVTNPVNGIVLSFIATRTDTGDAFTADTAHGATLVGTKSNGASGTGAAYCGLQWYPAGTTSAGWNWTASGGAKPATHTVIVLSPVGGGSSGATVTETGANASQGNTSSTGAATVTPAGQATATVTSKPLVAFGGLPLANTTIPNVVLLKLDRTVALSLANQVTNGSGQLVIPSTSLVSATDYMLAMFNADGTQRGLEKVTAV